MAETGPEDQRVWSRIVVQNDVPIFTPAETNGNEYSKTSRYERLDIRIFRDTSKQMFALRYK